MSLFRSTAVALVCFGTIMGALNAHAETVPIIPAPAHAVRNEGSVNLSHGIAFDRAKADADASSVMPYLTKLLDITRGPRIVSAKSHEAPNLVFVHRDPIAMLAGAPDESYMLDLSSQQVRITASSRAGYLYGAISLWQLLSHADGEVPAWHIEDAPRFRWRGLMLDSARHMQSEAFILQLIDYMAQHKLNVLHWHLVDDQGWRLEIKKYPRLTSVGAYRPQTMPPYEANIVAPTGTYGGFYTQEQVRHIVAYAMERNVTIVPEIEMPGHATAPLVAYPEFSSSVKSPRSMPVGWGIYPNLYNPTDATFQFLDNVLLEVMDLFPSEYIHLGGDEAIKEQWKASPVIQEKIRKLGLKDEDALQGWFMAQMESFLNQHGRKMVGWDEILDGEVSKTATVMSWRGTQGGVTAAKLGHDAILTPTRPLYFNYRQSGAVNEPPGRDPINSLADVYNFQASPAQLTAAEQKHIIGIQGSIWTEYLLTEDVLQHMLFPRAAALAEVAWSPAGQHNFQDFLHRLPADNERAEDEGIAPALSVFDVNAEATPSGDGTRATLALSTQGNVGEVHYTLDGSAASNNSPVYKEPIPLTIPASLHASAFDGATALGKPIAKELSLASALERDSRELDACTGGAGIQMEQDPLRNAKRPVFRVVFSNPCWIYRNAETTYFNSLALSVGSIPYIFRGPGKEIPQPTASTKTDAKISIYADSCKGTLLAIVPLQPAYRKDGEITLPAVSFTQEQGRHDLCFQVENNDPATVWLLHTIQPIPH